MNPLQRIVKPLAERVMKSEIDDLRESVSKLSEAMATMEIDGRGSTSA